MTIKIFDQYDGARCLGVGGLPQIVGVLTTYGTRRPFFFVKMIMSFYFYDIIYFTKQICVY